MASTFPGAIDSFTDPLSNSPLNSPSHSTLHSDINDAVEKVETYMGLVKVIPTSATNGTVAANGTVTIGNAVSSITVSGAFSSLYDNYRIIISGGATSTNTALNMTLGSTATGYAQLGIYSQLTVGTVLTYNDASTTSWASVAYCSANNIYGNIEIHDPYNAKWTIFDSVAMQPVAAGYVNRAAGFLANTTSYTAFTLTLGAGTMTGGTIRVYGYRN